MWASLILGLPGIAGKLLDYLGKRSDNTVLSSWLTSRSAR